MNAKEALKITKQVINDRIDEKTYQDKFDDVVRRRITKSANQGLFEAHFISKEILYDFNDKNYHVKNDININMFINLLESLGYVVSSNMNQLEIAFYLHFFSSFLSEHSKIICN